ncbi:MAG: class II aldolase/adducin family protein, partial [Deltaproteobacteria bacterium]|nr:class II aldolase/adducin family protein [Deltaproteobacteria bacterium]
MTKKQIVKELRNKVALSCRIIGNRGVTKGAFGHVSARIPETERILIKSKGPNEGALEFASEKDIITIDLKGNVLEASKGLDAPQETAMHLAVYRARPEVMSVIHTHPDWVVALTACEKPLLPIYAAYNPPSLRLLMEGIPLYPRSVTIINDELGEDFMRVMGNKKACLLLGHGMTTAG